MSVEYCQLDGYTLEEDDYFNLLISPVPKQELILNRFQDNQEMNLLIPKLETIISSSSDMPQDSPQTTKKRKSIAESKEMAIKEEEEEEEEDTEISSSSPSKKNKKSGKAAKKKKEAPKRKRINYCFEIHRSGCALNKDSKLYCKVFLKGKLQSEVDLIKGARGKWAYTFFDQRKKKKERRYWPSQSSGPVIEDNCSCDKCVVPNSTSSHDEEVDFSSPSTEDATFNEYDINQSKDLKQPFLQQYEYQQFMGHYAPIDQNQLIYFNKMQMGGNYMNPNDQFQEQYNQYQKNMTLKSSNDFSYNQRSWENYFHSSNVPTEYGNDCFFSVENNFL